MTNEGQQPQGPRGPATKPGAMTMAMRAVQVGPQSGPKVLRIGLIQAGKIVEERIVRKRETVSVGSSEKNHFIVQVQDLPSRFELFQLVGTDYILNFTDKMKGRVGLPGGVQDLDQLRASGGARNAGTHWQVKLNDTSRGKVSIGTTTLLFQFVTPPPVQPRPQLPAAARGGFVKSIDWLFTAFVVFSYMLFFGFVVYLESADWPLEQGIAGIPDDFQRYIFEEPPPPPEETPAEETPTEEAPAEEAPAEEAPRNPTNEPSDAQNDPVQSAEARARIAEEAASQAEALILGALGDSGDLANVLAGGAVTGNAADVLAQAEGVGVAQNAGGTLRTRGGGGGSGEGGGLGDLRAAGGGAGQAVGEGERIVERVIRGRVDFEGGDEVGGSGVFDQNLVTSMIRGRRSAFQRCYETSLRNNPTLNGKVTVEFTIQPTGGVTGARSIENTSGDAPLASCIVGVVGRLRWPTGPEDGSVTFSYPFVFAPQN
jgi:hypothetical protein